MVTGYFICMVTYMYTEYTSYHIRILYMYGDIYVY